MPRTETEMLSKAPIKVKLGAKDYEIPVLTILPSREWRMQLNEALQDILKTFDVSAYTDSEQLGHGFTLSLIQFPEKMAMLIFTYRSYGVLWESLIAEGVTKSELLLKAFHDRLAAGPLPEAPDFPNESVICNSTEEQIGTAFSRIMEVAYPLVPLKMAIKAAQLVSPPAKAKFTN